MSLYAEHSEVFLFIYKGNAGKAKATLWINRNLLGGGIGEAKSQTERGKYEQPITSYFSPVPFY